MKWIVLLLFSITAFAGDPIIWGPSKAKNLTNELQFQNGIQLLTGALDPSASAVSATIGSLYFSSNGTTYVKQDGGLTTNWLPFAASAGGTLSTINGQGGPGITIAAGSAGTDFAVNSSANTITLNIPTASGTNRGLLSSANWTTFNNKEPAITATTSADYYRGDKTFQPLDKTAVGLPNVDDTSDANKPVSTAQQAALDLKADQTDVDLKAPIASPTFTGTVSGITKAMVGLGSVDDTSDADKPISDDTQDALDLKQDAATAATDAELATKEDLITVLPISKGGTEKALTASAGQVVFTDADSFETLAAGTAGQVLQSNGNANPSWVNKSISGKAQSVAAVTVEEFQVPANLLTQTDTNKHKVELENRNLLANPSFDHSSVSTGWTITSTGTATCTMSAETTGVLSGEVNFGKLSAAGGASGGTCSIKQEVTTTAGHQALIKARFYPDPLGNCVGPSVVYNTLVNGLVVTEQTITNCGTTNYWTEPMAVPEISGTTTGLEMVITVGASTSTYVGIDQAYVGLGDVTASVSGTYLYGTTTAACSINTSSGSAVSTSNCTTSAGPGPMLSSGRSGFLIPANAASGYYVINANIIATDAQATGGLCYSVLYIGGVAVQSPRGGTSTNTDPSVNISVGYAYQHTGGTDTEVEIKFYRSVDATCNVQVNNINIVYHPPSNPMMYASQCGAACENSFDAQISSAGVVSGEGANWIDGNCSIATSTFTCTYVSTLALTTGMTCTATVAQNSLYDAKILTTTSTGFTAITDRTSDGVDTAVAFNVHCGKASPDSQSSRTIVGSFKEVVTAPGITKPVKYSATFAGASTSTACTSSPCTKYDETSSLFSGSVTRSGTGTYVLTSANGAFAANTRVRCDVQMYNSTLMWRFNGAAITANASGSITTPALQTYNSSGTISDGVLDITCTGQAP